MAREQHDREDLLAEATALVERIEFDLPGYGESIVAGFRTSACASLFFGADPVYQFNSQRQLRRAYVGGVLYKAERGRLVSLTRERSAGGLQLVRGQIDDAGQARFLSEMATHLAALGSALESGRFTIVGQVPDDADVTARVREWLGQLGEAIELAASPQAR